MEDIKRVTLAGETLPIAITFQAVEKISLDIVDPLAFVADAGVMQAMQKEGFPYQMKWTGTARNIPQIVHIVHQAGVKREGGADVGLEKIQELCMRHGLAKVQSWVYRLLNTMASGDDVDFELDEVPDYPKTTEGDAPQGN